MPGSVVSLEPGTAEGLLSDARSGTYRAAIASHDRLQGVVAMSIFARPQMRSIPLK
jgi:hypothetical protein